MKKFKKWLGKRLRFMADRVDDDHAFVAGVGTFEIVMGKGIVIDITGGVQVYPEPEGVQIWYRRDEYARKREAWFE